MKERGAEVRAAMLDIFDQEKVWEMALKAERREGREKGLEKGAAGIINICRTKMQMNDQEIIKTLMEELNLSRDKAAAYLFRYDNPESETE